MFAVPAGRFLERGNKPVAYFCLLLSTLYTYAVMTVWCVGVLVVFLGKADASSVIPTLLLSYGAATSAFESMAYQEQQGESELQVATWAAAFFAQIGYIVMMLMVLIGRATVVDVALAFGAVMATCAILQLSAVRAHEQTPSAGAAV